MLDVGITNKPRKLAVGMGSLNFCHPPSLHVWFQLRRIMGDIGHNFRLSIHYNILMALIVVTIELTILLLLISGVISGEPYLTPFHWTILAI